MRGKLYRSCVRSCMLRSNETWPVKKANELTLQRAETTVMCGIEVTDRFTCSELTKRLGINEMGFCCCCSAQPRCQFPVGDRRARNANKAEHTRKRLVYNSQFFICYWSYIHDSLSHQQQATRKHKLLMKHWRKNSVFRMCLTVNLLNVYYLLPEKCNTLKDIALNVKIYV